MGITTAPDGSLSGNTARYSYSGEQYPIASFNQDQQASISYRKIGETTVEQTVYLNGEVKQIGAKVVAPSAQIAADANHGLQQAFCYCLLHAHQPGGRGQPPR